MDSKVEGIDMKDEGLGWGKSLPVPSVQEMVKNDSEFVPERYIQDCKDRPNELNVCFDSSDIPIIDFSLLINDDQDELNKLDFACKEWGFFQVQFYHLSKYILMFFFIYISCHVLICESAISLDNKPRGGTRDFTRHEGCSVSIFRSAVRREEEVFDAGE